MNVVKVGHKQVVSLIRQGGNRLLMKVVSVTRKPESEEVVRKKGKDHRVEMSSSLSPAIFTFPDDNYYISNVIHNICIWYMMTQITCEMLVHVIFMCDMFKYWPKHYLTCTLV